MDIRAGWYAFGIPGGTAIRRDDSPAKEFVDVAAGTLYLADGTRIDFDAARLATFTDADIVGLAAARADTGVDAEVAALEASTAYTGFDNAPAKALITALITAVKGLGINGQGRQAIVDALAAIRVAGGDGNGDAARAVDGVAALITDADTLVAASDGAGSIEADERGGADLTIYVLVEGEGAARTVTVKSVATTAFATTDTEAGKRKFVIATFDADAGTVTMNEVGGSDVDNTPLTYKVTTTEYVKHVINMANRDDNAPEFVANVEADWDGFALVAGATPESPHHLEGRLAEQRTDEQGQTGEFTFTVKAEDPDNAKNHGNHTTETVTYAAAGDDGNDRTPIAKAFAADGTTLLNHNHLIKSVDGATGLVTLIDGALDYERADLKQDSGGKYFLFEIVATSTSTLQKPDGTTGTRPSTKNVFKLYVTKQNDAPDCGIDDSDSFR